MSKKIEEIDKKISVLKARKQNLRAKEKKMQRRHDTRRKIIIGAIVLKAARENEASKKKVLDMIENLQERDKKLFDGYFEVEKILS